MSTGQGWLPPTDDDPFGRAAADRAGHGPAGRPLAGFWQRAGATLLDALIVATAVAVLTAIGGGADEGDPNPFLQVLGLLISLLYAPVLMNRGGAANGMTWGKQAIGIRVAREDGEPVTFGTGTIREVVGKSLLGLLIIPTLASIVMIAVRDDKKAIWDLLARTRVVRG